MRRRLTSVAALAALCVTLTAVAAQPAQAGRAPHPIVAARPPMGWSSWSSLRGNISEAAIEAQADVMHRQLQRYGYQYVNVDAGWSDHLDGYGRDAWDATKFPHGIAPVARYVHSLGLKFGIYLVPGIPKAAVDANLPIYGTPYHAADIADTTTLGNTLGDSWRIDYTKPGAAQYIQSYADLLASWGVDYIKMDFIGPGGGNNPADNTGDIQQWRAALDRTHRRIHLELSNSLSFDDASVWASYANGWRIEGDVECYSSCPGFLTNWKQRVVKRWTDAPKWVPFAGPGHWNDMDSVEIGNGDVDGLTPDERVSVMTLWSLQSSPLLLGTDLTKLDPYDLSLLTNREVIAVDQSGRPARPVSQATPQQVWFSDNGHGSYTVALFNLDATAATVTANWSDLGITAGRAASVRDLWSHTDLGAMRDGFGATLAPHAARLLRVQLSHR
ncbi:glycoside hydrolase family 27 protein [Rugosimonospora africana]|uniref:Alpha-galactosidase n=1 Tax=Rugosimonospora africana TaxID=556532 RepID=A0A8J3VVA0_9ACTN|nr:glycoside hydrolase family 27 protein [Rugosimonospora africana]GIH19719.1 alpha-galactosidase [Rugosimonospora africana]